MSGTTAIEWADRVWNPVVGCTKASQGCRNCYAKKLHDMRHQAYMAGKKMPYQYRKMFEVVQCLPERLEEPQTWRRPARIFVNSMSDLFHQDVPDAFIGRVWSRMLECPRHTFMILTKRPERMADIVTRLTGECKRKELRDANNIWLGVSVEDQDAADQRIPWLLKTPAAVRFVSCEPLLGPVDLNIGVCQACGGCGETAGHYMQTDGMDTCTACGGSGHADDMLDWVIVGGESGPGARPMHPDWVRGLGEQCLQAGVPFFFKQWGEWFPVAPQYGNDDLIDKLFDYYQEMICMDSHKRIFFHEEKGKEIFNCGYQPRPDYNPYFLARVGKKRAGRLLDGHEWSDFPKG